MKIRFGLENCVLNPPELLREARFGLLANQASVTDDLEYSWDFLESAFPGQLRCLFSPQHGLWGEQQANMVETLHSRHDHLQIPVYSLYSETREPTVEMLRDLDVLVVDLQDVGTRVYTFVWTIYHSLRACAQHGIPVVILDRPNPLGGVRTDGPILQREFTSFVGEWTIPMQHGLTLAELARLITREQELDVDLQVVPLTGWERQMQWPDLRRAWLPPSPNLPTWQTAVVYPGQVLLEGTNLSEGRGTTLPFEFCGAPFLNPLFLARSMGDYGLPGVRFRPVRFVPTFDKWQGTSCGGVALHVTDMGRFRAFATTVFLLATIAANYPSQFALLQPPYEYEFHRMPIDILSGSAQLRDLLGIARESGVDLLSVSTKAALQEYVSLDEDAWWRRVRDALLYT